MAKIKQIIVFFFLFSLFFCNKNEFRLATEKTEAYFPFLLDKKIAIVGNQTSNIKNTHLVDSLLTTGFDIVRVFSPEHGFRGSLDAGEKVLNNIDLDTGIPVISLYGDNKKPNAKYLKDLDLILFDIQDVGVRFYTYISTLHYVMEAASENNIPVIVLDRPNPNGHYIDGPILNPEYSSFVGMHPIPIVHGMTIGEYAQMINGEAWISKQCDLTVIPMTNYNRNMPYRLPIQPSPNLPNERAVNLYPSLCLFEGTTVSVGRGTAYPFQHFGAPYLDSDYCFIPKPGPGSKYPKHDNQACYGVDLRFGLNYFSHLNLEWIIQVYEKCPDKNEFFNSFFDKLAGSDLLRKQIVEGQSSEEIQFSWQEDLIEFKKMRSKYLLY